MAAIVNILISSKEDQHKSEIAPPIRLTYDTIKHSVSFFHTIDIAKLCRTSRYFYLMFAEEMTNKKKVKYELIIHVFNADPESVVKFFSMTNVKKQMVLTRVHFSEGYYSKKFRKFISFREWGSISPIQAAARCLDNFLLLNLLSNIENEHGFRLIAADQLKEVLRKVSTRKKGVATEKIIATTCDVDSLHPRQSLVSTSETASLTLYNKSLEKKIYHEENKDSIEKVEYEDWSSYGAPYKALSVAYNKYITKYPKLSSAEQWKCIDTLWEQVSERIKRLPHYAHQEFFDKKPFKPLPEFDKEPKRVKCCYEDNTLLDLDELGIGTLCGLFKASRAQGAGRTVAPRMWGVLYSKIDSKAFSHLRKLRRGELENVIKCLEIPGAAITLGRPP